MNGPVVDVEQRVREIIVENLDPKNKDFALDAAFIKDLEADSLAIVELVLALEEEFDIDIPDEDTEKIMTVRDAVEYIRAHQSEKVPAAGDAAQALRDKK